MPRLSASRKKRKVKRRENYLWKKIARFSLIFVVFLLSFAFLTSYSVYKIITQKDVDASGYSNLDLNSNYLPTMSFIVVDSFENDPVKLEKVEYFVIDRQNKKVLVFNVPLDLEIDVAGNYSTEEFSKTFALGGLTKEDKLFGGVALVEKTLFRIFGYKPYNYILIEKDILKAFEKFLHEGDIPPLTSINALYNLKDLVKSDLSVGEYYDLYKFLNSLPSDRFIKNEVTRSHIDNYKIFNDMFYDLTITSVVAQEKKNIAVLNGTNISGLASFGSRVVENIGGRVVSSDNSLEHWEDSVLIVDDPNSETVRYLVHTFGIQTVINKEDALEYRDSEIERADITIIIGFDIGSSL